MSESPTVTHTNPDCLGRGPSDLVVPPEVVPNCKLCLLDPQIRELLRPLEYAVVGLKRRARTWATTDDGEAPTYEAPTDGWVCFHCGERFHSYMAARMHFGPTPDSVPSCRIGRDDLTALRRAEHQVEYLENLLDSIEGVPDFRRYVSAYDLDTWGLKEL